MLMKGAFPRRLPTGIAMNCSVAMFLDADADADADTDADADADHNLLLRLL